MVRLTYLDSAYLWKHEQILQYPLIEEAIHKLEKMIMEKPEQGLPDPILSITGKSIQCFKHSVNIPLFSNRYAIGYNFITANYIFNKYVARIILMKFT